MQQTFPAGAAQRIVMFDIRGDLFVHGWEQQTIQVTTDGRIDQLQPEDDTLTIRNCNATLELMVPIETVIEAKNIKGGMVIENVRQVEADAINGDVSIKTISGDVAVTKIGGDAAITSVGDELELTNVGGGLSVRQASSVHIRGHIGDDASFTEVERVDIERIDGDLVLIDVDEITRKTGERRSLWEKRHRSTTCWSDWWGLPGTGWWQRRSVVGKRWRRPCHKWSLTLRGG